MKYCFDFDGVIHNPNARLEGHRMGQPIPGALEFLTQLVKNGHTIYVHTARVQAESQVQHVIDWLSYFHFPAAITVCTFKPMADAYIDDKAVKFTGDWDTLL